MEKDSKKQIDVVKDVTKEVKMKTPSKSDDPKYIDKKIKEIRKKLEDQKKPKKEEKTKKVADIKNLVKKVKALLTK